MKGRFRQRRCRRDRLVKEYEHDPYKSKAKLPEPTCCPQCGAAYHRGRWDWKTGAVDAHETLCPACRRIRDRCPAGYLTLSGAFLREHRQEILGLAHNVETREKAQHPLKRIMGANDRNGDILITTTDMQLARSIGDALHHAYEGELKYQYSEEQNILRVTWKR